MSSQNKKKVQKNSKTEVKSRAESEVFVLPPNLLQKLGINLGGIHDGERSLSEDSTQPPDDITLLNQKVQSTSQIKTFPPKAKIKEDDKPQTPTSSILETAILMRKSVFLSPTFVSPVSSISGEIEISNVVSNSFPSPESLKKNDKIGKEFKPEIELTKNLTNDNYNKQMTALAEEKKENSSSSESLSKCVFDSIKKKGFEDYPNEEKKCDPSKKSKVTIINEVILTPSKAKTITFYPSQSKDLIPLSLTTSICKKPKEIDINSNQKPSIQDTDSENDEGAGRKKNLPSKHLPDEVSRENSKDINERHFKKVTELQSQQINDTNLSKFLSNNVDDKITQNDIKLNDSLNKVKEIAEYLSKYRQMHKTDDQARLNKVDKLVRQGVEKPGGFSKEHKKINVVKTYPSSSKKQSPRHPVNNLIGELPKIYEIDASNSAASCVEQVSDRDFCLCHDFGQMSYYDKDQAYNHIHFWEPEVPKCAAQVVFSIYVDFDSTCKETEDITDLYTTEEDMQLNSICWNRTFVNFNNRDQIHNTASFNPNEDLNINDPKADEPTSKSKNKLEIAVRTSESEKYKTMKPVATPVKETEFKEIKSKKTCNALLNTGLQGVKNVNNIIKTNESKQIEMYNNNKELLHMETDTPKFTTSNQSDHKQNKRRLSNMKTSLDPKDVESCDKSGDSKRRRSRKGKDNVDNKIEIVIDVNEKKALPTANFLNETEKKNRVNDLLNTKVALNSKDRKSSGSSETIIRKTGQIEKDKVEMIEIEINLNKKHTMNDTHIVNNTNLLNSSPQKKKKKLCLSNTIVQEETGEKCDHSENKRRKKSLNKNNVDNKVELEIDFEENEVQRMKKDTPKKITNQIHETRCKKQNKQNSGEECDLESTKNIKKKETPGKISNNSDIIQSETSESKDKSKDTKIVECGVCSQKVDNSDWDVHKETHCFIAWKVGDNFNLEEDDLKERLYQRVKNGTVLVCPFCNLERKYVKKFLSHIHQCLDSEAVGSKADITIDKNVEGQSTEPQNSEVVICAICKENVSEALWLHHICNEHHYLAWKVGEEPVVMDDNESVRLHLYNIVKQHQVLTCSKCGISRKYVKSYVQHVQQCVGVDVLPHPNDVSLDNSMLNTSLKAYVKCGVCHKEVQKAEWIPHIQNEHDYLAWQEGKGKIDFNNETMLHEHLISIGRHYGLTCKKCGMTRKYAKPYLDHIKICTYEGLRAQNEACIDGEVECALCHKKVLLVQWKSHAMEEHYNVAWCVGLHPIDIKNPYEVEKCLKEYKNVKKTLVCKVCKTSRASYSGFFAHVIVCGKSEEETEMFKEACQYCGTKYLGIYKNQHLQYHREQEYGKSRKDKSAEDKIKQEEGVENVPGKRLAAAKAQKDIEEYKSNDFPYICETCGFGSDSKKEFARHRCKPKFDPDVSEILDSIETIEDEDSPESADSDVSEEENEKPVRRRNKTQTKASFKPRLPFTVPRIKSYLREAGFQFSKYYYTTEVLYPDWRTCKYDQVSEKDADKYLPALEESCKITTGDDWFTLKRFNVKKQSSIWSVFTGACIQCISWTPDENDGPDKYLAVSCHKGGDIPKYNADITTQHPGCLQIWNFQNMRNAAPTLDLCIAHEYGVVWSLDWCPSGACDVLPEGDSQQQYRLGLLAIACSNGSAYVLSVPYPSTIVNKPNLMYKIKPVAELRLIMSSKDGRKCYQATHIRWSSSKGHSIVVVGYSDGTIARYDLTNDSPLLKTSENGIDVFYPYDDERVHNMCITGLDVYPSSEEVVSEALASSCATGAELSCGAGRGRVRARLTPAGVRAAFLPHWPSALIVGDDACLGQSVCEMEVQGAGRRLGAAAASAACAHCGLVAAHAAPFLRLLLLHPATSDRSRQDIGLLEMKSLKRKSKVKIDELAKKIEPATYEEAVEKYGINIQVFRKGVPSPTSKQEVQRSDRFPLAEVTSMAVCPFLAHHTKIAIATYSGVLFLIEAQ